MNKELNFVTDDWRKNYEKFLLSQTLDKINDLIGETIANPTTGMIKRSCGALLKYLAQMPLGNAEEHKKTREKLRNNILDIYDIVAGSPKSERVQALMKKHNIIIKTGLRAKGEVGNPFVRTSMIFNLPSLAIELNRIASEAGDFAQSVGLRVAHAQKKKKGTEKLLEEEGFSDLDIGAE